MDKSGCVTIPKEVRYEPGIGERDLIRIERRNDDILLKRLV
ncbi:AbrB/MazE/SpoVT family DNA-binding domain-containing protein [Candidatus Bathyarchaeota archaeon]|nr:AbrB/MazE/SpoVT family DNA-binding domain-containing protein [Candidatus Bathyarchaeota archaeon]